MTEQALAEYIINALWQAPLLAGGAWLLLRTVKPGPQMQHGVWLAVLGLAVLLPARGMGRIDTTAAQPHATFVVAEARTASREVRMSPEKDLLSGYLPPRTHGLRLTAKAIHWLVRLYTAAVVLGLLRMVRAWLGARHLVGRARKTSAHGPALAHYSRRLGVRPPQLRESAEVSSPMVVGFSTPVLLLPEGFARFTEEEVGAVLCHELAHIQRQDYLINIVCQIAALPLAWHPVVDEVQQRIRLTREMVCDAIAAGEMNSHIGYARCLLALANSMLGAHSTAGQVQFLGLFSNNTLEERVMRLMETTTTSLRARAGRAASGAAMMIAAGSLAVMYHITPIMAQSGTSAPPTAVQATAVPAAPSAPSDPQAVKPTPGRRVVHVRRLDKKTEQQIEDVRREVAKARVMLDSPGFKRQIEDAQRQAFKVTVILNSPEIKLQMEDAQRQVAATKAILDSPAFKRQIEEAQRQALKATATLNSPEFKQQMEEVQRKISKATAMLNNPEFKQRMDELQEQLNSAVSSGELDEDDRNDSSKKPEAAPTQ